MAGPRKDGTLPGEDTGSSLGYWAIMLDISFVLFFWVERVVSGQASYLATARRRGYGCKYAMA
jgi:hypothetical protein